MLHHKALGFKSRQLMTMLVIALLVLLALHRPAYAEELYARVTVAEAYIEIHTSPGRGYPVFYIAERGETLLVLKQKTSWYKVRTEKNIEGWVSINDLGLTLDSSNELVNIKAPDKESFINRKWESGFMVGDFDGSDVMSVYAGYHFTRNLSMEVALSNIYGDHSDGHAASVSIVHQLFPQWRVSPFFTIGGGIIDTNSRSNLVATKDRSENTANVGAGLRIYLDDRFLLRLQYKNHIILTNRDDDEEVDEWKIGLSVFY